MAFQSARRIGKKQVKVKLIVTLLISFLFFATKSFAEGSSEAVGKLGSIIGKAHILRNGQKIPAKRGMPIFATDSLVTSAKTAVKIQFNDGGNFMAFEDSALKIEEYDVQRKGERLSLKSAFNIAKGKVRFFVKPGKERTNSTTFKTKNAVMGIRGTSGYIDATQPGRTQLIVTTGKVEMANPKIPGQSVMVPANFMTELEGDSAPKPPRQAPAGLINNLNRQSQAAEQAGQRSTPDGSADPGVLEQESEEESGGNEDSGSGTEQEETEEPGSDETPADDSGGEESAPDEGSTDGEATSTESDSAAEDAPSGDTADSSASSSEESASASGSERTSDEPDLESGEQDSTDSEAKPAAKPVKRVKVFSEDGSSSVAVSDSSLAGMTETLDASELGGEVEASQLDSTGSEGQETVVVEADLSSAAATDVLNDVTASVNTTSLQRQIEEIVDAAIEETQEVIKSLPGPVKKQLEIRVVLPE